MFGWMVDFKFFLIKKANRFSFFWKTFRDSLEKSLDYLTESRRVKETTIQYSSILLFLMVGLPFFSDISIKFHLILGMTAIINIAIIYLWLTGFLTCWKRYYLNCIPDIMAFENNLIIPHLHQKLKTTLDSRNNKKSKRRL